MFTAVPTTVVVDDADGRTGKMKRVVLSGKDVKGWEKVAQLGCC